MIIELEICFTYHICVFKWMIERKDEDLILLQWSIR